MWEHLGAAGVALAATVLMTWPLAPNASDHLLQAIYHWDAYTNAMIMGSRVDAAVGRGPLSIYDNYFFAPLQDSIVFNENHFGLSLIFAPFYLLSDNPLWAYNLTLLVSLSLSVFFTYLLVRRLSGSATAGMLAGVAFAFCPYVFFEMGRIQLVATQWIPACFWFLHRAIEHQRSRDVAGLWLCYVLQIGTCLYYAMFLIPLLGLSACVLLYRHRPAPRLYVQLAAGGAVAAGLALGMVYPYFAARRAFDLERSLSFASSYDGKLSFFGNVHETSRTLTFLHHPSEMRGAYEEIAFPGFTVLALSLLALAVPLWGEAVRLGWRQFGSVAARWLSLTALAFCAMVLTRSMLSGVLVLSGGIGWQLRARQPLPFAGARGLYLGVLLLSIAMFLGLSVAEWNDEPIRGLYYYFHTYFPGFNGIRKVSRQAVMTSFVFCVLAGFGAAWLASKLPRGPWQRPALFVGMLSFVCYELRTYPHPTERMWNDETIPSAYRFIASLPEDDLVTIVPQNDGASLFWGDRGMALHNYLALFHKHRFVNGQSSWMPAVNELVRRVQMTLPSEAAWRLLAAAGARHILVHGEDLTPQRRDLPERLSAMPDHFEKVFHDGGQSVFSLRGLSEPSLALLDTPALPAGATALAPEQLRATANLAPQLAHHAVDGDLETHWSSQRGQARGQYFELQLNQAHPIIAFEIENIEEVMQVPMSYRFSVATAEGGFRTVAEQPVLRLHREQIHSPKTFVFRLVLPEAVVTDRVRITIEQPVPGFEFTVREARIYAMGRPEALPTPP